ncbi:MULTISPECIES: fumarylacetoacetate hydrolase family protein [Amycolatopsis]|uniref:Fumarylacetoacetate hydrolase family protein n=1 Tax=Amycolatopsis dongchuanensis TaxID=1070866 RepID=A0ABP8VPD3_9PSEU
MEIRRLHRAPGRIEFQTRQGPADEWQPTSENPLGYAPPFGDEWEIERLRPADGAVLLPFQPLSFRDFMIYEQHVVDAGRGYARRFLPAVSRLAGGYEALTRRVFPAFQPNKLWYRQPVYYMSNALTFVPSGTPVSCPPYSQALDYELELGFVLGRPLRDASPEEAEQAIAAFVVLCDFSARDVQIPEMRSGFGPQKAKHFVNSLSATAVTADAVRWRELTGAVRINGEVVAEPRSADARYSLGELLAHASRGENLYAGELFATGTLPGGSGMENGHWLRPGDTLRLEIEGVGAIEHPIS